MSNFNWHAIDTLCFLLQQLIISEKIKLKLRNDENYSIFCIKFLQILNKSYWYARYSGAIFLCRSFYMILCLSFLHLLSRRTYVYKNFPDLYSDVGSVRIFGLLTSPTFRFIGSSAEPHRLDWLLPLEWKYHWWSVSQYFGFAVLGNEP